MLLTKEVEIIWTQQSRKRYELKGYKFTQYGDKFKINVNDLVHSSPIIVKLVCDCCGKVCFMSWRGYIKKYSHKKFCCVSCSLIKYRMKHKSFYEWCIENYRQDLLDRWDYKLNKFNPKEISYHSNIKIYFKCSRNIHKSKSYNINDIVNNRNYVICNQCNSFAQWGLDNLGKDFLTKYWDWDKNENISPWEIAHESNNKVWIKCQEKSYHGSYKISCAHFFIGRRCPYCLNFHNEVHRFDSLGWLYPEVLKVWSTKNKKSPFEYAPQSSKKVWWKCPKGKHKDYLRNIEQSVKANFRCPQCTIERQESFIEEKVRKYIESKYKQYIFNRENSCTLVPINPKNKHHMPFDNELIFENKHLLIEVNGIQHYEICGFHKLQAKEDNMALECVIHKQKLYDRYKKYVAFCNGYFYMTIPYWDIENDERYKILIDDKIKMISKM